jgi:hypothetical protein
MHRSNVCTEAEAKRRWCPMTRVLTWGSELDAFGSYNRNNDRLDKQSLCIASQCMMWRWTGSKKDDGEMLGCCGLAAVFADQAA